MGYSYVLQAEAQAEYEVALAWYLERSVLAAENFVEEVDHIIELICQTPYRWRNEYDDYRELGLKKYPYSIVYTIEEENKVVVVSSIYHHSRSPVRKYRK